MLRTWQSRQWLLLAGCLTLLGLGLPVGSWEVPDMYLPGTYLPGYCVTSYDYNGYAYLDCSAGTVIPGIHLPGSQGSLTAAKSGMRVFVAVAVAVAYYAVRHSSPAAARATVLIGVMGIARYAVPPQPGTIVLALALLALSIALQERQLLRLPGWLVNRRHASTRRTTKDAAISAMH